MEDFENRAFREEGVVRDLNDFSVLTRGLEVVIVSQEMFCCIRGQI